MLLKAGSLKTIRRKTPTVEQNLKNNHIHHFSFLKVIYQQQIRFS
jgi:hypothetical protein